MRLLKTLWICSIFLVTAVQAEDVTGVLGYSNSVKGFYVFGFTGSKNKDPACKKKYLIPDNKTDLIKLVKVPNGQVITVAYSYQKIVGGGTRDHCVVSNITVDNSPVE